MSLALVCEPKRPPLSWEEFLKVEPFAIALDGYVADGPRMDLDGPRVNYNHHEGVSRLETRSTCGQVTVGIRQGLFRHLFRSNGVKRGAIYVNDCDEDVCLSWWLLKNSHLVEPAMNPAINRLVHVEDMLDATAGAYPFPADLPLLGQLAWIFEPYRNLRQAGGLGRKDSLEYASVITDVEHRITKHVMGEGEECPIDARYEKIGGGKGWVLAKEIGAQAKTGMFADGVHAYVTQRQRPDGRFTYVVGKMSPFVRFNVPRILDALNTLEFGAGLKIPEDRWGGGDMIGGSPRVAGSSLSTKDVEDTINSISSRA